MNIFCEVKEARSPKLAIFKLLHESIHWTFLKRQNYGDGKQIGSLQKRGGVVWGRANYKGAAEGMLLLRDATVCFMTVVIDMALDICQVS